MGDLQLNGEWIVKSGETTLKYSEYLVFRKPPNAEDIEWWTSILVQHGCRTDFREWLTNTFKSLSKNLWLDFLLVLANIDCPINIDKLPIEFVKAVAIFHRDYPHTSNVETGKIRYSSSLSGRFVLGELIDEKFHYRFIREYDIPNGTYFKGLEVYNSKTPNECVYIPSNCGYPQCIEDELKKVFGNDTKLYTLL